MAEIRILNGDPARLRGLLGNLAEHVELRAGDAVLEVETDETVGRTVFERLITQGYLGYSVGEESDRPAEMVKNYDPSAHPRVLMVAMPVGG